MNINPLILHPCCISKTIPLAFDESLSYLEMVAGILNKLNETISQTNQNTEDIETLVNHVNNILIALTNLKSYIDLENAKQETLWTKQLLELQTSITNMVNVEISKLENEIKNIELGLIDAYNPTNGKVENLNKVLEDIYEYSRCNGITCGAYDNLKLSASTYDGLELTAFEFDYRAKILLRNII